MLVFIPILYVRIRYPFWSTQPVFHTYDYLRYLTRTPFQIHTQLYSKSYKNDANVKTIKFLDMDDKDVDKIVNLLQSHYVESDQILSFINKQTLTDTFSGQFYPSYISFYNKDKLNVVYDETGAVTIQNTPNIVGCMTGRSIHMFILDKSDIIHEKPGYYWDYICVHRDYTHENLGRKMIQSHDMHQRSNTKDIGMSLFKKEINLCEGVVPLVKYQVLTFALSKIHRPPIPAPYNVYRVYNDKVDTFYDLLYKMSHQGNNLKQQFVAFPDISVLDTLIQTSSLLVYALKYGYELQCIYLFKNPLLCYDGIEGGHILECTSTIFNTHVQEDIPNALLFTGFLHALHHIQKSFVSKYKVITFHNLGHNHNIIERWRWKYNPLSINDAAYYLYNGVIAGMPVDQTKCTIVV